MAKAFLLVIVAYVLAGAAAVGTGIWFHAQQPIVMVGLADLAATIVVFIFSVITILSEEAFGQYRTSHLALVIAANASWIIFPLIILFRLGLNEHPFTRPVASTQASEVGA